MSDVRISNKYVFDQLVLDPEIGSVIVDDQLLEVTEDEFCVLEHLLLNSGKPLDLEELYQMVHEKKKTITMEKMHSCIKRLKQLLETKANLEVTSFVQICELGK